MLLFEDLALVPIIFLLGALAPAASMRDRRTAADDIAGRGVLVVARSPSVAASSCRRMFAQAARDQGSRTVPRRQPAGRDRRERLPPQRSACRRSWARCSPA
jgi:hypothetical protein